MTSCKSIAHAGTIVLAVLLSLFAMQAHAGTAATVLFSHGQVQAVSADDGHRELHKGDSVFSGDTIITGRPGRIQMRFSDGGLVSLMPGTTFVVRQYQQPDGESNGSLVFNLVEGGLRTLTGSIGHKDHDDYKLKTSVATLGIRGTQYIATMDDDTMRAHVGQGQVELYNDKGSQLLDGGENGVVKPGQAPQQTAMSPHYISAVEDGSAPAKSDAQTYTYNQLKSTGQAATLAGAFALRNPPPEDINGTGPEIEDHPGGGSNPGGGGHPGGGGTTPANPAFAVAYRPAGGAPVRSDSYDQQQWQQALQAAGGSLPGSVPGFLPVKPDTPIADIQPNPPTVHTTGNLVWGEVLTAGNQSGPWAYYQPYVWGLPTANVPVSGTLNYSLADATAARHTVAGVSSSGTLDKFDLAINLNGVNAPTFDADMEITIGNTTWFPATPSPVNGSMDGASFKFDANFNYGGCPNCQLDVAGLLSGANAEQAGLVYKMLMDEVVSGQPTGNTGVFSGGAVLHK